MESPPNLLPPKQVLDMKAIMNTIEENVLETMKKLMKEINWSSNMSKWKKLIKYLYMLQIHMNIVHNPVF